MKISELIKILQLQLELRGDIDVYSDGQDYPGEIVGVRHNQNSRPYYTDNCLILNSED